MNTKPPNLVLVNQAHKLQANRFHKFIHSSIPTCHAGDPGSIPDNDAKFDRGRTPPN